jgi:hypothetical protein
MAFCAPVRSGDLDRLLLDCADCNWHGPGARALKQSEDVVRCPCCLKPLHLRSPLLSDAGQTELNRRLDFRRRLVTKGA